MRLSASPHPGTFFGADLVGAFTSVILAIFAIVTAWYARKAFLKQSQKVSPSCAAGVWALVRRARRAIRARHIEELRTLARSRDMGCGAATAACSTARLRAWDTVPGSG